MNRHEKSTNKKCKNYLYILINYLFYKYVICNTQKPISKYEKNHTKYRINAK